MIKVNVERDNMEKNFDFLAEFFNQQGIKFIDVNTGEEIKAGVKPTITCKICGNETPKGQLKCMWCQNRSSDADC